MPNSIKSLAITARTAACLQRVDEPGHHDWKLLPFNRLMISRHILLVNIYERYADFHAVFIKKKAPLIGADFYLFMPLLLAALPAAVAHYPGCCEGNTRKDTLYPSFLILLKF